MYSSVLLLYSGTFTRAASVDVQSPEGSLHSSTQRLVTHVGRKLRVSCAHR